MWDSIPTIIIHESGTKQVFTYKILHVKIDIRMFANTYKSKGQNSKV